MSERDDLRAALRGLRGDEAVGGRRPADHPDESTLVQLLENRLAAAARPDVEAHVAACDDCATIVALELRAPADATPHALRPPARARVRWRRVVLAGAIAAGVALAVGPGVWIPAGSLANALADGASRYLGRTATVAGAAVRLGTRPGVRLTQVRLGAAAGTDGDVLAAEHLDISVLPGDLLAGRLGLDVTLERPVVKLAIDDAGIWNVEGIGRRSARGAPGDRERPSTVPDDSVSDGEGARARRSRWRLADGAIAAGRIEIATARHVGAPAPLVLDPVSASFVANPSDPGAAGLLTLDASVDSRDGPRGSIAVAGTAGPFDGTRGPRWDLRSVRLADLPIDQLPGAPSAISGSLDFVGHLGSTARDTRSLPVDSTGGGDLTIDEGVLHGRNLARDLVTALGEADGAEASSWTRAVAAALVTEPEIAAALSAADTRFRRVSAQSRLAGGVVELASLQLTTELFAATGSGSVAWSGSMSAEGDCEFTPRIASALVAAAPRLGGLRDTAGRLRVPFAVAGRWPDIRLHIELERGVASAPRSSGAATTRLAWATRTASEKSHAAPRPATNPLGGFGLWYRGAPGTLPGSDPRG